MKLLLDTNRAAALCLRVFSWLSSSPAAGILGWRRTLFFGAWVWPLAWLAEFASTRIGVPFGLYHYTGTTRGQEIYVDNVRSWTRSRSPSWPTRPSAWPAWSWRDAPCRG